MSTHQQTCGCRVYIDRWYAHVTGRSGHTCRISTRGRTPDRPEAPYNLSRLSSRVDTPENLRLPRLHRWFDGQNPPCAPKGHSNGAFAAFLFCSDDFFYRGSTSTEWCNALEARTVLCQSNTSSCSTICRSVSPKSRNRCWCTSPNDSLREADAASMELVTPCAILRKLLSTACVTGDCGRPLLVVWPPSTADVDRRMNEETKSCVLEVRICLLPVRAICMTRGSTAVDCC